MTNAALDEWTSRYCLSHLILSFAMKVVAPQFYNPCIVFISVQRITVIIRDFKQSDSLLTEIQGSSEDVKIIFSHFQKDKH